MLVSSHGFLHAKVVKETEREGKILMTSYLEMTSHLLVSKILRSGCTEFESKENILNTNRPKIISFLTML